MLAVSAVRAVFVFCVLMLSVAAVGIVFVFCVLMLSVAAVGIVFVSGFNLAFVEMGSIVSDFEMGVVSL